MRALLLASVVALGWIGAASAAPVVGDASFEAVSVGSGYSYDPTDVGGWTFTSYAGVAGNGSAFGFSAAPSGNNVGFIQSYNGQGNGTISQTITGLTVGTTYTVSFDLAARPNYKADPISVALGGVSLGTYTVSSTSFTAITTTSFLASSTSALLAFSGGTSTAGQDLDAAIDLVSLTATGSSTTAVPEPASMALLGVGMLGTLAATRRRRRS